MFSELQNNSRPILLVIIIILSIIIGHATYNYFDNKQEGLKNIFSALACPLRILKNIDKCVMFWLKDVLWRLIHLIIKFLFIYPFIFMPVWLVSTTICICTGLCWNVSIDDVCPTKTNFFKLIENIKNTVSSGKYLYRDSGDIKKCYCIPSIKKMFDPLTQYRSFIEQAKDQQQKSNVASAMVVPLIILGILYIGNKVSSGGSSTGLPGVSDIFNSLSKGPEIANALTTSNPLASITS